MLHYFRYYPLSILLIGIVCFASLAKAPALPLNGIPGMDKWIHTGMYLCLSGMLWGEFIYAHRKGRVPVLHAWIGAFLCPILLGGVIELLQAYCTYDRSGDWLDFAADCAGTSIASVAGYFLSKTARK